MSLPLLPIRHVLFGSGYVSLFSWLFAREKLTCLNLELRVPLPLRKDMVLQLKLNETFSAACENSRLPLGKFRQGGNVPSGEELSNNLIVKRKTSTEKVAVFLEY